MGDVLNRTGSTAALAGYVGGWFTGIPWFPVLLMTIVLYFYAHYAFASITAHMLSMFPPFVVMLIGLGTPPALAVYSLACMANLTAGLTHYGTTTAPIVFAEGYVSQRDWWRVGFAMSVVNIVDLDDGRVRVVEDCRTMVATRTQRKQRTQRRRAQRRRETSCISQRIC